MKKIKLTAILFAFLRLLTVCGTSAGNGNAQNAEESANGEAEQATDAEQTPKRHGAYGFL